MVNSRLESLSHPLTQVVLTSFSLIQRIPPLAVKVAKVIDLYEVKARARDAAEQIDDLLMRDERAFLSRHEAAAPLIRTERFGSATRPNFYAAIADH